MNALISHSCSSRYRQTLERIYFSSIWQAKSTLRRTRSHLDLKTVNESNCAYHNEVILLTTLFIHLYHRYRCWTRCMEDVAIYTNGSITFSNNGMHTGETINLLYKTGELHRAKKRETCLVYDQTMCSLLSWYCASHLKKKTVGKLSAREHRRMRISAGNRLIFCSKPSKAVLLSCWPRNL